MAEMHFRDRRMARARSQLEGVRIYVLCTFLKHIGNGKIKLLS
jgi:hypothetical protein